MQIIQQTTRTTAQEIVKDITITYGYENEKDSLPIAVAFSASRNNEGNTSPYTTIQGSVTAHDFNVQNTNFLPADIELYKHIHTTCTAIIQGKEPEK